MDLQKHIDNMSKVWRKQRSQTQMTLGKLIEQLEATPKRKKIVNICKPHSYRGYYSDLSFELGIGTRTVGSLLKELKQSCLKQTFTGYKGGDFYMDSHTHLWIACYGCCGKKIMTLEETKEEDMLIFTTCEDSD